MCNEYACEWSVACFKCRFECAKRKFRKIVNDWRTYSSITDTYRACVREKPGARSFCRSRRRF